MHWATVGTLHLHDKRRKLLNGGRGEVGFREPIGGANILGRSMLPTRGVSTSLTGRSSLYYNPVDSISRWDKARQSFVEDR